MNDWPVLLATETDPGDDVNTRTLNDEAKRKRATLADKGAYDGRGA
jgi:hypothetical protein